MTEDRLTFYVSRRRLVGRPQYRWRYQSAGNNARLANGGEGYNTLHSAVESAFRVCGLHLDPLENLQFYHHRYMDRPGAAGVFVKLR